MILSVRQVHSWTRAAMYSHLRSTRAVVWAALLALLSLALSFLPLFDVLGFERSFVLAIAGSIAGADLGAAYVRRLKATAGPALDRATPPLLFLGRVVARASLCSLAMLVLPLAISCLNAFWVRNCDWWFGLEAFAMLTMVSTIAGSMMGILCGLVAGRRRWLSIMLPYVTFALAVIYGVWRFYVTPAVFSYSVFAGYFPGNLYDESVALRSPFYWSRLFDVCSFTAALALSALIVDVPSATFRLRGSRPTGFRLRAALLAATACAATTALWLTAANLGFRVDAEDIKQALSGRIETEHFVIHYPRGTEIERDIELIADDHEFRYAQTVALMGAAPEGKTTSFYFASAEEKFKMMGARRVYMAKPWRHEIYLHHSAWPHQVLRHEIAHVVAGAFGDSLFNVSVEHRLGLPVYFNVGLIEGIAVAMDWPDHFTRALTPHQSVKALIELGMAPPVQKLFSTGFLAFSSARSYTMAGSFIRFLLDEHGAETLRTLYGSGGDFGLAYGSSEAVMIAQWRQMIDAIELPAGAAEVVRERFRRPSIFKRPCPHAIARMRERIFELMAGGEIERAVSVMRSICAETPGEPSSQLELAVLLTALGDTEGAAVIYRQIAGDADQVSSTLRARSLLALVAFAAQREDLAAVEQLLTRAAELPVGDDLARNIAAQKWLSTSTWPAAPSLRSFFWGRQSVGGTDPLVSLGRISQALADEPDSGMAHYLLGRNLRGRGAPLDTTRSLARALELGLPHPLLIRECARLLVESAYRAGDLAMVERAAAILTDERQPEVIRLTGYDWLERVAWKRTGTLPAWSGTAHLQSPTNL